MKLLKQRFFCIAMPSAGLVPDELHGGWPVPDDEQTVPVLLLRAVDLLLVRHDVCDIGAAPTGDCQVCRCQPVALLVHCSQAGWLLGFLFCHVHFRGEAQGLGLIDLSYRL